jgi:hypothetical protein
MDTVTLVKDLLDDGQKLVVELLQRGFEMIAAFWLKASDDDRWYFYLVSPVVETEGIAQAYGRLHPLVRAMPQPLGIDLLKIKLIGPSDPIAQDVVAIQNRSPRPGGFPFRWKGRQLGNKSIDGVYIYPLPAPTPSLN